MMSDFGFVYALCSPCMPGMYKIGSTKRSPHERASEVSNSTGVPEQYLVAFYIEIQSPLSVEKAIHRLFDGRRVSANREFFQVPLIEIIRAMEGDGDYVSSWDSDMAVEARYPGQVSPYNPLWFEQSLHSGAFINSVRRPRQ
ncbi:GIY-YIG nuclease family protein [Pseudomonas syringae group genomosp. 3]|uniref:GIY-YIG nuclease family protein n=1 Tax=Pseudomonas syringae group genomosp. 3 TaxID=251701 RepID=UPI001FB87DB9|nr:GIY-YIG nuclease family protein [Pseudomonas syringae group genomosp. 3]